MTFSEAHSRIEEELTKLNLVTAPEQLYQPIEYTLSSGGKRIRPALCLMACDALGGNVEDAIYPAIALEVFHNFTLLHDDIMDDDEVRRNQATVHKKWDRNTAILSGDAMQILAYKYLARVPECYLKDVLDVFSDTALKVCEGQQYDMDFETQDDVSIEEYLTMIECKTAVLLEASLRIGAMVSGADKAAVNLFGQFGKNLGLAFQLRDDWLDTFGDLDTFGKDIGSDIANNKKTYLLISALQAAKGEQLEELKRYISGTDISQESKIEGVMSLFRSLEIDVLTQKEAEKYYELSVDAIEQLDIKDKDIFISLTEKLLKRSK